MKNLALAFLLMGCGGLAGSAFAQRTILIASNQLWRYTQPTVPVLDGTAWPSRGYDDSAWSTGRATLAWETTPSTIAFLQATAPINTLLEPPEGRTDYFRAHFTWSESTAGAVLILSNAVDDGAVIYLNGVEQARIRLLDGAPDVWGSLTTDTTPGGDVAAWEVITLGDSNLVTGDNLLAVSVHQHSETSSDVIFGMIVLGIQPFAPVVADPSQPEDVVVRQGQSHVLAIAADGYPAPAYQWFFRPQGGDTFSAMPGATDAAYEIAAMRTDDAGHYYCQLQNPLGTMHSRTNTLAFSADQTPPLLVSAVRQPNLTNIVVTFSEPMAINALSLDSYAVCINEQLTDCLEKQPTSADGQTLRFVEGSGNTQVLLGTDLPLDVEQPYVLAVTEVSDRAGNAIPNNLYTNVAMPKLATFRQGVAGYAGTVDTHIRQDQPSAAFPTNTQVLVDSLSPASQGLLRFDHLFGPDAGQISFGAVIHSASLSLRTLNATRTNEWINFHRMLQPWNDTSTWNTPWPGGLKADEVIAASALAAQINPTTLDETLNIDVTATLQAWADGHLNYGWFLTNTMADGYQFASSEHPTEAFRPQLTVKYEKGPPVPVSIVVVPRTNTLVVNHGQPFSIAFGVGGTDIEFQWFRDNAALPDETNGTLSRVAASVADAGDYYLHVQNDRPSETNSPVIQVTLVPDPVIPQLVSAVRQPEATNVLATFSKRVFAGGVTNASNYLLSQTSNPGIQIPVVAVALGADNTTVLLQTVLPVPAGYTLTVSNVTDLAGNALKPNARSVATPTGFVQGLNGYAGARDTHVLQNQPDEAFGTQCRLLVDGSNPISHGLIRFDGLFGPGGIAAGAVIHSATLRLHTDNVGDKLTLHRMLIPWDESSTWNSLGGNGVVADGITAVATADGILSPNTLDQFVTVDVTAAVQAWATGAVNRGWGLLNTGTDGFQCPSSEADAVLLRPALIGEWSDTGACLPVSISGQPPASQTVGEGQPVRLTAAVFGTNPSYQWHQNNQPIAGATNASYTLAAVAPTNAGTYRCLVTNACPSSVTSQDAVLSVTSDTIGPWLLSAQARSPVAAPELRSVVLTFNEPVLPGGAQAASNYTIYPAGGSSVPVTAAALSNATTVRLTLNAPLAFGTDCLVEVGPGVTDTAMTRNPVSPNRTHIQQQIVLLDYTHTWRYDETRNAANNYDTNVPAWYSSAFDASGWATGAGLLAWETDLDVIESLPAPIQTALSVTNQTIYLRTTFRWPFGALPNNAGFAVNHVIDDGVICYLNGSEAFRYKLADGPVIHTTRASARGEAVLASTNLPAAGVTASNLIACSLHPINATSTDAVFGLEILAQYPGLMGARPELTITRPVGGQITLTWMPDTGRLQEAASPVGPWSDVVGATNQIKIPIAGTTRRFYSLRQ